MKNMTLGALLALLLLPACEGFLSEMVEVNPQVDDFSEVLVINAEIERGKTAWLQMSYVEDIEALASTPVKWEEGAKVTLSTGDGQSEELSFVTMGLYGGNKIKGKEGETYTMTVVVGARTYSATQKMNVEPGIGWFAINGMTNAGKFITDSVTSGTDAADGAKYSEEWKVLDPRATRDRYLFEYYVNGTHLVRKDWAIDDNRVVNSTDYSGEGLKLFNVTINPGVNQYLDFRVARIDKPTYDYYNMYEKIVRGLIGVGSVTPYNPKSNFSGERTVGNFRAVSFSATAGLAPPSPCITSLDGAIKIGFAPSPQALDGTPYFVKYHLYKGTAAGVDHTSDKLADVAAVPAAGQVTTTVDGLSKGTTYYFRLQVEDAQGRVSPLSPVVSAAPGDKTDTCKGPVEGAEGTMTCGGVTIECKQIYLDKAGTKGGDYCQDTKGVWRTCKNGEWTGGASKGKTDSAKGK